MCWVLFASVYNSWPEKQVEIIFFANFVFAGFPKNPIFEAGVIMADKSDT